MTGKPMWLRGALLVDFVVRHVVEWLASGTFYPGPNHLFDTVTHGREK